MVRSERSSPTPHATSQPAQAQLPLVADLLATLVPDAKLDLRSQRALELLQAFAVPFGTDAAAFLSEMVLARETDLEHPPQKVALLTLHASKGLEFPLVFIAGCEDGILPLRLPWLPPADVEEERRLLYVGMTRAQQRLILTAAIAAPWPVAPSRIVPARFSTTCRPICSRLLARRRAVARHASYPY